GKGVSGKMVRPRTTLLRPCTDNLLFATAASRGFRRGLNFFHHRRLVGRFDPHCEKGAEEKKPCAPELRGGEVFAEKVCGQSEGTGWTNQLQGLGESNTDPPDRDVI